MSKISFTKIESILSETILKMMIEKLTELATIATLIQDPLNRIPDKEVDVVFKRIQTELAKLKIQDPKFYQKLEFQAEEEEKLAGDWRNFSPEDWNRLKVLKEKIETLRKELWGSPISEEKELKQQEAQIETERLKHINKRFNIRDGWLPLR